MEGALLITQLPIELIEHILESRNLTDKDIYNFGATCTKFWNLVSKNNKMWKAKFNKSWPGLLDSTNQAQVVDWEYEFKIGQLFGATVGRLMLEMPLRFCREDYYISHGSLPDFWAIMERHPNAYHFLISVLMMTLDQSVTINPILKSYAEQFIRMLRQAHLTKSKRFLSPSERHILERGEIVAAPTSEILSILPAP